MVVVGVQMMIVGVQPYDSRLLNHCIAGNNTHIVGNMASVVGDNLISPDPSRGGFHMLKWGL